MTNSVGTSSCFCCFDLKIGGLIIGYIGLICNVLEVALWNDTFEMNCISLCFALASIIFLCGIHTSIPQLILPYLILKAVFCMFQMFLVPILALMISDQIGEDIITQWKLDDLKHYIEGLFGYTLDGFWIWFATTYTAIQLYLISIMYALFKTMKQANENTDSRSRIKFC